MTALLGVDLSGRRVLAVGGGPVSARRVAGFLTYGAHVVVVAPEICEDLAELVAEGALEWVPRDVDEGDLAEAWLVHTATGDRDSDAQVAAWAQRRRVWCVDAGDGGSGSARVPATGRVAGVAISVVSTEGPDPARTARLRDALVEHVQSGAVDLRARRRAEGRVILVGGGPGAPDLMTLRGMQALRAADVVVTDRLGPTGLLADLAEDVEVIDVGKSRGNHPVPQHEINRILVEYATRGRCVVRLKGGDPFLLGRGGEEVLACHEAGVPVEVVPGVTSAISVPAAAGIPVTHRGTATAVHVVTGHDGLDAAATQGLRAGTVTVVVLMGVAKLPQLVGQALSAGVDPQTPVAIVERGWLPDQRVTRTTLSDAPSLVARQTVRAPAVVVIGAVAAIDLASESPSPDAVQP